MEQYVKRCVNQIKNFHLDLTYAQKGLKPNSINHHLAILERQATQQVNNNVAKCDTKDFQKTFDKLYTHKHNTYAAAFKIFCIKMQGDCMSNHSRHLHCAQR